MKPITDPEIDPRRQLVRRAEPTMPGQMITLAKDLLILAKAKVVSLLLFSAMVGEFLAPDTWQHLPAALAGLCGIALAGGAGGVLNQLIEPTIDRNMERTRRRPLANGRVTYRGAVCFALLLLLASMTVLVLWTNLITLTFTLTGTIGYGLVYTVYLKPATPWNIVWGGLAGAMPPLIGWTAVGAPISLLPFSLVALTFVWTPAHFWPLALCYRDDYRRAGIPMLPVTHGVDRTRREIVNYAVATLLVSLIPSFLGAGLLYGFAAACSGLWYLYLTLHLARMPIDVRMDRYARRVFSASISYLAVIYGTLIISHTLHILTLHFLR